MAIYDYDIAVIGAGPGGYVAAIKAAQAGKRTCVVEAGSVGGVCLNEGCIPTKTLIKTATLLAEMRHADAFAIEGVDPKALRVSMPKLQKRKQAVVGQLVNGVKGLLRGNKAALLSGTASFVDAHTILVDGKKVTAEHLIIATGSEAFVPPFIAQEGNNTLLTSREALSLDHVPASVTVIGGGVIGIEFAYLLNKLGAKVTVVELLGTILPMVDEEVSSMARKRLEKDGIAFHLGAKVAKIRDNEVFFEQGGKPLSVAAEAVLMAVGRVPKTRRLNADAIGIEFDRLAIKTDACLRTSVPNIYAIGDVNGKVMLAHTASHEAMIAVDAILGGHKEMDYGAIPSCIYLDPEIAAIGLTEKQAREKYADIRVGKFPMAANGKSLVEGDADGMIKVITDGDLGAILGVHMYGKHVTDMIAEIAIAMKLEATATEIIQAIHPHPTVSEAVPEAFMAAVGRSVHSL